MKKLILLAVLACNVSHAKIGVESSKLAYRMNNFDIITTNNKFNYMSLKFALLATLVEKVDYSKMDLESPYSYSAAETTYEINNTSGEFECAVKYNYKELTMRKNGKIIKIKKGTDFEVVDNNPVGCAESHNKDNYRDYLEVVTYYAPTIKEFKETLGKTLREFKPKNPSNSLNNERTFHLSNDGFTISNEGEQTFSAHATQAINPDIIFAEDSSDGIYKLGDIDVIDLNEKVTEFTEIKSVYIGNYSYILRSNPFIEQSTTDYTVPEKAQTIKELLKTL